MFGNVVGINEEDGSRVVCVRPHRKMFLRGRALDQTPFMASIGPSEPRRQRSRVISFVMWEGTINRLIPSMGVSMDSDGVRQLIQERQDRKSEVIVITRQNERAF